MSTIENIYTLHTISTNCLLPAPEPGEHLPYPMPLVSTYSCLVSPLRSRTWHTKTKSHTIPAAGSPQHQPQVAGRSTVVLLFRRVTVRNVNEIVTRSLVLQPRIHYAFLGLWGPLPPFKVNICAQEGGTERGRSTHGGLGGGGDGVGERFCSSLSSDEPRYGAMIRYI